MKLHKLMKTSFLATQKGKLLEHYWQKENMGDLHN